MPVEQQANNAGESKKAIRRPCPSPAPSRALHEASLSSLAQRGISPPTIPLVRNVHKEITLVQTIILKAKIWAIWGNFNFPILESKLKLLVVKQCHQEHSISKQEGKPIWRGLSRCLGKHLAEST